VSIIPGGRETGDALVRHPGVDKISFTGSSATGRHIASLCGEQLKRVSLETRWQVRGDHPSTTPTSTPHRQALENGESDEKRAGVRGADRDSGQRTSPR